MRILLVDDRPEMIDNYKRCISEFNGSIEVIEPNSFSDLDRKILTQDFDSVLADKDLSKWRDSSINNISDGKGVCDFLVRSRNFLDVKSNVVLYSAHQALESKDLQEEYTILEKLTGPDVINRFQTSILHKMSDIAELQERITLEKFTGLPFAKQISYYKKILAREKKEFSRFDGPFRSLLWTSDLIGNDNLEIVNYWSDSEAPPLFEISHSYEDLDQGIQQQNRLPALYWNLSTIQLLSHQKQIIEKVTLKNKFIELFFNVAFANAIATHLLQSWHDNDKFDGLLDLLDNEQPFVIREVQCQFIELMASAPESEKFLMQQLSKVGMVTGLIVADYFEGNLRSYDTESNVAEVRLVSKINNKYFTREFNYSRLEANGVKYKDSRFSYCVYEHEGSVVGYIEPI